MRVIEFRGMDLQGNWHYGNLAILTQNLPSAEKGSYISNSVGVPFAYDVRPETVGEFTGLLDKNGKKIFNGDILRMDISGQAGKYNPEAALRKVVEFKNGCWGFRPLFPDLVCEDDRKWCSFWKDADEEMWNPKYFEIIGNIYEHPHLLTEEK